jgi:putative heme-binding domain-containing protein
MDIQANRPTFAPLLRRWRELVVAAAVVALLALLILPASQTGRHPRNVNNRRIAEMVAKSCQSPEAIEWLVLVRPFVADSLQQTGGPLDPNLVLAALIAADGYVEPAWQLASTQAEWLVALAGAMSHLPDAAMRLELHHYLLPLIVSELPPEGVDCDEQQWLAVRQAALQAVALVPARDEQVASLAEQLAGDARFAETISEVRRRLGAPREVFVRRMQRAYSVADASDVLAAAQSPSLARGRRLFYELACYKCHPISGPSGPLGPSLSSNDFATHAPEVFASIVDPNAKLDDKYRQHMLVAGGRVLTGSLVDSSETSLVIVTDPLGDCEPLEVELADLDEPAIRLQSSPMPSGMVDMLTPDELCDLVLFVAARGSLDRVPR